MNGGTVLSVSQRGCLLGAAELFAGNMDAAIDRVGALRRAGGVQLVVTLNVDQVLTLDRDDAVRAIVENAAMRTIDGAPLLALARLLGARDMRRITGADLIQEVARAGGARGWRIAILGGSPGVAERAARRLRADWGADVHCVPVPMLAKPEAACDATLVALHRVAPDVVFVCMGAPKQEFWVERWRARLPAAVYVGAGAAVDFAAGSRRRAPTFVQRLGCEWLWRLALEPRRLAHRYLVRGPRFWLIAGRSVLQALLRQGGPHDVSADPPASVLGVTHRAKDGVAGPGGSSVLIPTVPDRHEDRPDHDRKCEQERSARG